jgi:hypothetical protein
MPLEAITLQQARPLRKANAAKTAVVAVVVNTSGILYGSHEEEISVPDLGTTGTGQYARQALRRVGDCLLAAGRTISLCKYIMQSSINVWGERPRE